MLSIFPTRTIAISWDGVAIHWYGIMYAVAFWMAYAMFPYLGALRGIKISREESTMFVVYAALGVLIGGRLGYALLYEPLYFLTNPLQVFAIWGGGMSSHGGFIGVAIAVWLWARYSNIPLLPIADMIAIPAAIGLALGRVGNIINQEFGIYPYYEVAGDIVIAIICYMLLRKKKTDGIIIALFLILYSIERFLLEYIRPQEWSYIIGLTRGQFLTIPIFIIGMLLFLYARAKQRTNSSR